MAEFLYVYDANRNLIGTADRKVVHTFGLWHKTVHCWIISGNKLAFQRRSKKLDNNPGKLYTTASGHITAGESIEDAFAREIEQEIGVRPTSPKKLDETVWIADIKKTDDSLFIDRVFCNRFYAEYGDIRDFQFSDGEVDAAVAIDLDNFITFARGAGGEIFGTEWDGKNLTEVKLTADDFLVNSGETLYGKFGKIAEMIRALK